jgi:hypothetical protein
LLLLRGRLGILRGILGRIPSLWWVSLWRVTLLRIPLLRVPLWRIPRWRISILCIPFRRITLRRGDADGGLLLVVVTHVLDVGMVIPPVLGSNFTQKKDILDL